MLYKYKAVSESGQVLEGVYEARTEDDVIAMIRNNSYLPVSIEKSDTRGKSLNIFTTRVKKKDLAIFCRQFYTMLNAGISIVKCLDILEKQVENNVLKKAIGRVCEDVQKGFTLSEAMKKNEEVFPSLFINMIEAGEVSGNLDTIMERMSIHYEKENKIENKVKSALAYPIVLSIVAIGVVIFLLTFVMPTFIGMFESSGVALPAPTRLLLNISYGLQNYWHIFIPIVIALIVLARLYSQTESGSLLFDSIKIKMPGIKKINIKIITSRFARTLATLMASGISLLEALDAVSKVVGNKVVAQGIRKAKEDVRKGAPLSRTIKEMNVFPPMLNSMLKVGEESGSLDEILTKTADFYDEEAEVSLQNMTTMLEPIMTVFMAIIIGFIVISMAMPMFDMVNTIQI